MDKWVNDKDVLIVRRRECTSDYVRQHCVAIDFHQLGNKIYGVDPSKYYSSTSDCLPYQRALAPLEELYHENLKPYYKVHSTVLDSMLNTRIDEIPMNDFKVPFSSFAILLPKGNKTGISQVMMSSFSTITQDTDNSDSSTDQMWYIYLGVIGNNCDCLHLEIPPHKRNMSIEEFMATYLFNNPFPARDSMLAIVPSALHIACSVSLLATGSHKYIEEDIMEHLLVAYRKSGHKKKKKFRKLSLRAGYTGYSIGRLDSERRLPNGIKYDEIELSEFNHENESGTKQSRRMHIRCGHYRYQACGQRWQDRKLIWIVPMFVGLQHNDPTAA